MTVGLVMAATLHAPHLVEDVGLSAAASRAVPNQAAGRVDADEPLAGLTHSDWSQIRHAMAESEYYATSLSKPGQAAALVATNRQQAYRTTFRREGIEIVPGSSAGASWRLALTVTGYGYVGHVRTLPPADPDAAKERVEYRRGPVTEWYVNRPVGLEQGFEMQEPRPRAEGPLVVAMAVQGDLAVTGAGQDAVFAQDSGNPLVRYSGLKAWDADGRSLPARLEAEDRTIRLVVDASDARFPVTVDPIFVHEAQVFPGGDPVGEPNAAFGSSVSLSGDTVVVGVPFGGGFGKGAAYVYVRSGTTWFEQQKILASDAEMNDQFGHSVSVDGDTIVVGSNADDTPGTDSGSAYVFVRSGTVWTQQQKLKALDAATGDAFGDSVAISGDTIVVGALADDNAGGVDAGAAYVFVRSGTTWSQEQKLLAADAATNDKLGHSVSVSLDTAVVGAYLDDTTNGPDSGAAYVFVRAGGTWSEQQKLTPSDGAALDHFAVSVSISGDTVVAGADFDDTAGGANAGSGYVFVRSGTTWTEQQKLLASDGAAADAFGSSVSISGDTVVIGAPLDDNNASGSIDVGSAYVFIRSGTSWSEQQKLAAPDQASWDLFGTVAVFGDTVVVGAVTADNPGGQNTGSAYAFARSGTTWTFQWKFVGGDSAGGDTFGTSVSVSGDTVVVGAPTDDSLNGVDSGSAYVFVRSGSIWIEQKKLTASDGAASDRFGTSVSISGETVVIGAYNDNTTTGGQGAGSAYVFVRSGTTWNQQQKLVASDALNGDAFGWAVSISGDTVLIGAVLADGPFTENSGAAYVFVRDGTNWTEQQKLVASDAAEDDFFGWSVSLSGDTAIVGVPYDDNFGLFDDGSAYVFVRVGTVWVEQQKLVPPDPETWDAFGHSVTISSDTAVVGAPLGGTTADGSGSAYVFVRSGTTWTQQKELGATDAGGGDDFGESVALSGDTAVVGAPGDNNSGGSAYVFVRSGTTWTQQQKLLAPDMMAGDLFGTSVGVSGATLVVGAALDDVTADFDDTGSAHVFRDTATMADVAITKTDGVTTVVPGQTLTYAITVTNLGPDPVMGGTVSDLPPSALLGVTWSCTASAGSSCTSSGSGSIVDVVNLLVGGSATYTLSGTVDPAATGSLVNSVAVSGVNDPNPANNSASDVDTLAPGADLGVTKAASSGSVFQGEPVVYLMTVTNAGPSVATQVVLADDLPTGVTFVSSTPGPPMCNLSGGTVSCALGTLTPGGNATVTIDVIASAPPGTSLVNTANVFSGVPDRDPGNNTASATTTIKFRDGELTHGTDELFDLAALPGPVTDEDVFRISQKPRTSYEVVIDATSGDIGAGVPGGPVLERLAADAQTVLQSSVPIGKGFSRSLRWMTGAGQNDAEFVRVRSAECGTDCGPDDVYRIRAYETTYSASRFNNTGTQVTFLILQNPTNYDIQALVSFFNQFGGFLAAQSFSLSPKATLVLDTRTVADLASGSITIAHDGRYGDLAGKAVALEPSTGFSFDSALEARPK